MKILFIVLTACLLQIYPALAQTPKKEPLTIDQRLGITKPEQEIAPIADRVKRQALRYYNDCIGRKNTLFSPETQQLQCGCIANTMIDTMNAEDILTLYDDSDAGAQSRSIFFTDVHGSCAKYPIYDYVMNKCMANKGFKRSMLTKHRDVCECSADTMARYVNHDSTEKMIQQLSLTPETQQPINDYIEGREFVNVHSNFMRRCVLIHIIDPP